MSLVRKGASAFGKLFIVLALAGTFVVGAVGVVYMSLQGAEMKVPEIVGKDLVESEKELAALGLRIKKRADRYSNEKPNTILEQLPKAGDTVKTGQMILVVTSKTNPEGEEAPTTIKKTLTEEEDDSKKIEELISDKPKKSNKSNTNTNKKKSETTRDVISNNSNSNSNSSKSDSSDAKNSNAGDKSNKNTASESNKPASNKANSNKAATGGDVRPRKTPEK
jgi:hypothetical protein